MHGKDVHSQGIRSGSKGADPNWLSRQRSCLQIDGSHIMKRKGGKIVVNRQWQPLRTLVSRSRASSSFVALLSLFFDFSRITGKPAIIRSGKVLPTIRRQRELKLSSLHEKSRQRLRRVLSVVEQLKGVASSRERMGRACESLPRWVDVRIL